MVMKKNRILELLYVAVSAFSKSFLSSLFFVGFIYFSLSAFVESPSPFDLFSIPISILGAWFLFFDFKYVISRFKSGLKW